MLLRPRFLATATLALTGAVALSPAAGADPVADARRDRDRAQAAAVAAAQRYVDALSDQARQEAEIARLEAEIPALRARSVELRRRVRRRAIDLYKEGGNSVPIVNMIETESAMEAARALSLASGAANADRGLAAELTATAVKLEHDQARLRQLKAYQDRLVDELADQRAELDRALADANVAVERVAAVVASQAGFTAGDAAAAGRVATRAAVCPIGGPVAFVNDWGAPRSGGRTHQGTDLFATYGTWNIAVVDGWMEHEIGGLGGISVWLHGDDGVSYYYAHLSRIEGPPRRVARGDIIGYVGDSGNAAGGPPHTHFGMRADTTMVNPYPTLRVLCPR